MCQKVTYTTKADAVADSKEIYMQMRNSKKVNRVKRLKPYKCRFCDNWHLSSKNGRGKQYGK